jgi:hypothetical protein
MGTDSMFGRPNSWPGGPDQALVGQSKPAGRTDMGTDTEFPDLGTDTMSGMSDMVTDTMSDIPIRNV